MVDLRKIKIIIMFTIIFSTSDIKQTRRMDYVNYEQTSKDIT